MPKKKLRKTLERDKYVREATGPLYDAAKSYMNKPGPIKKRTRKKKRNGPNRRTMAINDMKKVAWEKGQPLIKGAYDMAAPYIRKTISAITDKGKKGLENFRIPELENKPSWVDLREALNEKLSGIGILDDEETIDISIFFRGAEDFLNKYKGIGISKKDINEAMWACKGKDPGSAMDSSMKQSLANGISVKSIGQVLEYLFHDKISPSTDDMEVEVDGESEGWSGAVEKKRLARLAREGRSLEVKADAVSQLLQTATLPRDVNQYTRELNQALHDIADYLKNKAEDGKLIHSLRDKFNSLANKQLSDGHKIKNPFTTLMDLDYGSKKKKKRTKKRKKHTKKKKGFFF